MKLKNFITIGLQKQSNKPSFWKALHFKGSLLSKSYTEKNYSILIGWETVNLYVIWGQITDLSDGQNL